MAREGVPVCARHEREVEMTLRTLHSDASRPGQLVGHFECPECGWERRVPVESAA
jgi:hypothetical protein